MQLFATHQQPLQIQAGLKSVSLLVSDSGERHPIDSVRNRVVKGAILSENYYDGSWLHSAIKLLLSGVDGETRNWFNAIWRKCKLHLVLDWETYILRTTELSTNVKQWQSAIGINWRYLVDLQLIAAYQIEKVQPSTAKLLDWLSREHSHGDAYEHMFSISSHNLFSMMDRSIPLNICSVEQFVDTPALWATSGSSRRAVRESSEISKNKWTLAYLNSRSMLLDCMYSRNQNIIRTFVKPDEPLKSRHLGTADDPVNMQMSYLSMFIEPALSRCGKIASHLSNSKWVQMYTDLVMYKSAHVPTIDIDQTDFDHQPTKSMVMETILNAIGLAKSVALYTPYYNDVVRVSDALVYSMEHTIIEYEHGSFDWQNGIASGWRWTSILGSLINLTECDVIDADMRECGYNVVCLMRVVQGDDVSEVYTDESVTRDRISFWQNRNFDISIKKTISNRDCGEFLRMVYDDKGVSGYPARVLHSICIYKDGKVENEDALIQQLQTLKVLGTLQSRKGMVFDDSMVLSHLKPLAHMPTVYGGLAIYPVQILSDRRLLVHIDKVKAYTSKKNGKRLYAFQSERIGYSRKVRVRARRFSQLLEETSSVKIEQYFAVSSTSYHMSYLDPDDVYRIVEEYQGKELEEQLIAHLTPQSLLHYDIISRVLTRKMRILCLQNKLPQPTVSGLQNARIVSIYSDQLTGAMLTILNRNRMTCGMKMWESIVSSLSIGMNELNKYYHGIHISE